MPNVIHNFSHKVRAYFPMQKIEKKVFDSTSVRLRMSFPPLLLPFGIFYWAFTTLVL